MKNNCTIGIDIGGTKIYGACYDANFQVVRENQIPTPHSHAEILESLIKIIDDLKTPDTKNIGIAWAGFVSKCGKTIRHGANIGAITDFPLATKLEAVFDIPVMIENDARAFAYAESFETPKPPKALIGIILGTGMGSGLILDGRIYKGADNFAGEVGHTLTQDGQEIEKLIAGPAMTEFLKTHFPIKRLEDMALYFGEDQILSPQLLTTVKPRLELLTLWLTNLTLLFNPDQIVIGGGAGLGFWQHFDTHIQKGLENNLQKYPIKTEIRFSQLKHAGALGVARLMSLL